MSMRESVPHWFSQLVRLRGQVYYSCEPMCRDQPVVGAFPGLRGREVWMPGIVKRLCLGLWLLAILAQSSLAQKALTWQEVRDKFEAANPTLRAGQIGVDEAKAAEITAYLRPNPSLLLTADQLN